MYISGWLLGQLTLIPFVFIGLYLVIRQLIKNQFARLIGCLATFVLWIGAFMAVLLVPYETCTGTIVFSTLEGTVVSLFTTPRFVIFTAPSIVLIADLLRNSMNLQ